MVQVISTEKGVSMGGGLSVSSMGVLALKISVALGFLSHSLSTQLLASGQCALLAFPFNGVK